MISNSLRSTAWKQILEATLDCIFEKREFHFHGSPSTVASFKERLTMYYACSYRIGEELQWPANLCN